MGREERRRALLRWTFYLFAGAVGLNTISLAIQSLSPEWVYRKDLIQEYVLGRAVLEKVDPYLPLPDLAARFVGPTVDPLFPHPTPHPPPMALVSLPLAAFDYPTAAALWLVFEYACLIAAAALMLQFLEVPLSGAGRVAVVVALLGTDAVFYELTLGQVQSLLLLVLVGAWIAFRSGRDGWGGVALGCSLALKLLGWPLVLYLFLRRRWRAVWTAGATFLFLNAVSAGVLGTRAIMKYYLKVVPQVTSLYGADPFNLSSQTIGWRLFEGTESHVQVAFHAEPLVHWPAGAVTVAVMMPVFITFLLLIAAMRARSFDAAYALLLGASILASPITWIHYGVLLSLAVLWIWAELSRRNWPRSPTLVVLLLSACLFFPSEFFYRVALKLGETPPSTAAPLAVPASASFLTLLPAGLWVGVLILVWHMDVHRPEVEEGRRPVV